MAVRGVRQLKELLIRYSDYDGSSAPIRNWIRTDLVNLARENPDIAIRAEIKRNAHPFFRGYYVNGNNKTICVKNLSAADLTSYFNDLRNQVGRKVLPRKNAVTSKHPSIQGEWHEKMDLLNLPFQIQHIPRHSA